MPETPSQLAEERIIPGRALNLNKGGTNKQSEENEDRSCISLSPGLFYVYTEGTGHVGCETLRFDPRLYWLGTPLPHFPQDQMKCLKMSRLAKTFMFLASLGCLHVQTSFLLLPYPSD